MRDHLPLGVHLAYMIRCTPPVEAKSSSLNVSCLEPTTAVRYQQYGQLYNWSYGYLVRAVGKYAVEPAAQVRPWWSSYPRVSVPGDFWWGQVWHASVKTRKCSLAASRGGRVVG